jgi:uncharacterized protein (DUF4415 family)
MTMIRKQREDLNGQADASVDWPNGAQPGTPGAEAAGADPKVPAMPDEGWFRRARLMIPEPKVPVSIRLDREVLDWFKRQGPRYQTRINAVLRAFVAAQQGFKGPGAASQPSPAPRASDVPERPRPAETPRRSEA